ncbi:hypothetical protein BHE74_00001679 [Ensete ventricosum]|nr:hypothetical protein BHE74_00001679 [Ensete ventricosum]
MSDDSYMLRKQRLATPSPMAMGKGAAADDTISNGGVAESSRRLQRRWRHGLQATMGEEVAVIGVESCSGDQ